MKSHHSFHTLNSLLFGLVLAVSGINAGLDETTARQLRQAAWQTVIDYYPEK